jgi:hypothetical protein
MGKSIKIDNKGAALKVGKIFFCFFFDHNCLVLKTEKLMNKSNIGHKIIVPRHDITKKFQATT